MNITFAPRNVLQINNARIIYRNFSGAASMYNRAGDRNFAIVIPDKETADELIDRGWTVNVKPARDDGEDDFRILKVKVKFTSRGPNAYLVTNGVTNKLDEETIGRLDRVDILNVDLDINPYDWEVNGKAGRSAYLDAICVTQRVDRFASNISRE